MCNVIWLPAERCEQSFADEKILSAHMWKGGNLPKITGVRRESRFNFAKTVEKNQMNKF